MVIIDKPTKDPFKPRLEIELKPGESEHLIESIVWLITGYIDRGNYAKVSVVVREVLRRVRRWAKEKTGNTTHAGHLIGDNRTTMVEGTAMNRVHKTMRGRYLYEKEDYLSE